MSYDDWTYLVQLFKHSEDQDGGKGADHAGGVLGTEGHAGKNRNDQEVNVCRSSKLVEQG